MNGAVPAAYEILEFEHRLELNGGFFTRDQYVAVIGEFAERRAPNREINDLGGEAFEI